MKSRQSLSFVGPQIWNNLPVEVKKCIVINDDGDVISSNFIPLKHFKLAIKKHAISNIEYF